MAYLVPCTPSLRARAQKFLKSNLRKISTKSCYAAGYENIVYFIFAYRHTQLRARKPVQRNLFLPVCKPLNLLLDIIKVLVPNPFRETIKMGPPNKCILHCENCSKWCAVFPFPRPAMPPLTPWKSIPAPSVYRYFFHRIETPAISLIYKAMPSNECLPSRSSFIVL